MKKAFLLILFCIGCGPIICESEPKPIQTIQDGFLLKGTVTAVTDGDTVTVTDSEHEEHRIRLGEIDAPEKSQEFGKESSQEIKELLLNKNVTVYWKKKDRFDWKTSDHKTKNGRIIGGIYLDGKFVNRELVERGCAWHYKQFSTDKTLDVAEKYARNNKYGLWNNPTPTPPWEYRKK